MMNRRKFLGSAAMVAGAAAVPSIVIPPERVIKYAYVKGADTLTKGGLGVTLPAGSKILGTKLVDYDYSSIIKYETDATDEQA